MTALNTISLPDFVKLANVKFQKALSDFPEVMRKSGLFVEVPMENNTGNTREFSEIDLEEYASNKDEGDQAETARIQQGYTNTLTLSRRGDNIDITVEMRTQNKYPTVVKKLTSLGSMVSKRLDLDLAHRLGFGTATSYVDQDGITINIDIGDDLALYSTVHKVKGSATTYRNRLANNPQLSKGALEGLEKLIVEQTFNQFAEKISVPFDILWTTDDPNTCNTARELLQSSAEVSAPNAGVINVYKAKYQHIKSARIATDANGSPDSDKAKYFGIASSADSSAYLGIHEEAHMVAPESDIKSDDWTFGARGNNGNTIVGGRWIKFSSGDGTA